MDSYRFVIAVRAEKSSMPTASPTWRGWIEQVYPSTPDVPRCWFQDLDDVSLLIAGMISGEN